ncbi:MAG: BamA/TamA family outer membrane protein [Acidobacteria bacterium]|nr:BamA/TamA family outer membrane protein [Acidobacteriota bacterium]
MSSSSAFLAAALFVFVSETLPAQTLPRSSQEAERVAERVAGRYRERGYTFARVTAVFDAASAVLSLTIEEGVIDRVEFEGVGERIARLFRDEFALRSGDVFNAARARQALDALLRQTRGAIRPGRASATGSSFTDSRNLRPRRSTFDLVDRNGERVLVVALREPAGRFKIVPDFGEREDWFSSVDGFVPSLGFGAAVFDHEDFNHTYLAGHLSLKTAADRWGYALGGERPLFGDRKLFLGAEFHDLTASDDQWQVSSLEASLAAVGPRRSFRDYYRREGLQLSGALRVHRQVEMLFAWRGERQTSLATSSDFSLWRRDESFRPNVRARDGQLNAVVIGASIDGRGFDGESLEATYRRHQLDTLFGERLNDPEDHQDGAPIWRIDWTSELSSPGGLGSDFDFRRHIVNGRARVLLSQRQDFGARALGGWSEGTLPPQRMFAIGGIGSVHGYDFKAATGDALTLMNLEYELGWRGGLKVVGFLDAGRVTSRLAPSALLTGTDTPWMKGVGWGIGLGDFRIDFGYKLDTLPSSPQVLLRFGRTF